MASATNSGTLGEPPVARRRRTLARPRSAPEPLAVYTVGVQLPEDAVGTEFSLRHPDLRLEVTNRMEVTSNRLLAEVRISDEHADRLLDELARMPGVVEASLYSESERTAVYRIVVETPVIQNVIQRHRILTRYPIVVQGGWLRFTTVASPAQIRLLVKDLQRRVGHSVVESVQQGRFQTGALHLTPPQEAVFREALAAGFFTIPRQSSVSQLAARLRKSKSTVSVALAQIQSQLVHAALQIEQWSPPGRGRRSPPRDGASG